MKDPPVLVVDLRPAALDRERRALAAGETTPSPPDEPLAPDEAVATVAVLHDGSDDPLLLPIEPTRDRARLDAIGRVLRFAVLRGERMPKVAVTYGSELERRLAFERQLPRWAYEGVDAKTLATAPPALRRVLGRPDRA